MAFDQESLCGVLVENPVHGLAESLKAVQLVFSNLGRTGVEGDGVEIDTPHLVPDARGVHDLIYRVDALHRLDGRRVEIDVIVIRPGALCGENVFVGGDIKPERWQIRTCVVIAAPHPAIIAFRHIVEHDLAAVGHDAGTAYYLAIRIAHRHHPHAIFLHD